MRRSFNRITLLSSTTGTGTASGTGSSFEVGTYDKGVFFLDITACTGTSSPTLAVKVETYNVLGNDWLTLGTFTTGTATGTERITSEYIGERIRGYYLVGGSGTSARSFTFSVEGLVKS